MKKFVFLSIMLGCFFLVGCGNETYLAPGAIEQKQETYQETQEQVKSDNSVDIFSKQEKCHSHLKEAESRYDDHYVNVYYSPVLNTCILDVSWIWDGDESGIMYLATEWNLKDFYTDKEIFSCTMFRDSLKKDDWFVYDEKYFDEDTISLFEAYGNGMGECNYLYDWASEYLQEVN